MSACSGSRVAFPLKAFADSVRRHRCALFALPVLTLPAVVIVSAVLVWCVLQDAQRLLYLLERFYLQEPALVETFNKRPKEFDFNRLLSECP